MKIIWQYLKNKFEINSGKDLLERIVSVCEIVGVILTLWSVLLVRDTLVEMRVERNNSYRPIVYVCKQEYIVQVDDEVMYLDSDGKVFYDNNTMNEFDYYDEFPRMKLKVRNIGVGTAKDVRITISSDDCFKAIDEFNRIYKGARISLFADETHGGYQLSWHSAEEPDAAHTWGPVGFSDEEMEYSYILPNAEEFYDFELPILYSCLIKAMWVADENAIFNACESNGKPLPDIPISIEYYDVQGVKYLENAVICTTISDWMLDNDGGSYGSIVFEVSVNRKYDVS